VAGILGSPATFAAIGAEGSWVGIHVRAGGSAEITQLSVNGGITSLQLDDSATISASAFAGQTGLRVKGGTVTVNGTAFSASDTGVDVAGGSASFSRITITGGKTGLVAEGGTTHVEHALVTYTSTRAMYAAYGL